ncbi:hypothetical protein CPA52_00035 [Pseudoalteromonas marina]|nr:hypothetical protein CPA52_00035 [Pseudoalteromonas marina]
MDIKGVDNRLFRSKIILNNDQLTMILLNKYQNSFYNGRFLLKIELITCISAKKFWIFVQKMEIVDN